MKKTLVAVLAVAFVSSAAAQPIPPQAKERAAELVGQMTLDEKIDYIGGYNEFYIRAVPRLGIPEIRMADGPQGVRNNTRSTMFPCGVAAAATWDRALVRDMGRGLGQDARARGVHLRWSRPVRLQYKLLQSYPSLLPSPPRQLSRRRLPLHPSGRCR